MNEAKQKMQNLWKKHGWKICFGSYTIGVFLIGYGLGNVSGEMQGYFKGQRDAFEFVEEFYKLIPEIIS